MMARVLWRMFAVALAAALPALHGEFKPGRGEFKLTVYGKPAYKKHPVKLDPNRAYLLTGTYRTEGPATEVSLGMELRDADGFPLRAVMFTGIPGSETELAAPLAKGDTAIRVKDASFWRLDSGKLAVPVVDFKALKLSPNEVAFEMKEIVRDPKSGTWILKLVKPARRSFPAGTKIRRHAGRVPFNAVWRAMIDGKKRTFKKLILPGEKYDPASRRFYPGTRSGRIFTVAPAGVNVYFSNLKCVPVEGGELEKLLRENRNEYLPLFPTGKIKPQFDPDGRQVWKTRVDGGFQIVDCRIPQAKVKQIEALVSADRPGLMGCFFNFNQDGEEFAHRRAVPMRPDGKRRWMIVFPEHRTRRGVLNYLNIAWRRNSGEASISVERVRVLDRVNLVPGANDVPRDRPVAIDYVKYQGKPHKLEWTGGANPGMKIEWFDAAGKVVASTELPAGKDGVEFTLPELAVRGELRVAPGGSGEPALRPLVPADALPQGEWIWCQRGNGPENTNVWFEKKFDLAATPVDAATLSVGSDDSSQVYLNGRYVGAGGDHIRAARLDAAKFLKPGTNTLAVKVRNHGGLGALVCALRIVQGGGETFVSSDASWRCAVGGDAMPGTVDRPVVSVDIDANRRYWNFHDRGLAPRTTLEIVGRGENFFTARVAGEPPKTEAFLLYALRDKRGGDTTPLSLGTKVTKRGELYRFDYARPFLCRRGDFELVFDDDAFRIAGSKVVAEFRSDPKPTGLAQAAYRFDGGRPKLVFNGREYAPFFWKFVSNFPLSYPEKADQIAGARRAGYRSFALSTDFPTCWPEKGRFDFSLLDAQVEQLLSVCPDAVFMIQMGCFMPDWWLKENPDDATVREDGTPRDKRLERQALSSQKWLEDARLPLEAFVEHIRNSPYGDRVWGVNVAENTNWEWFWWITARGKGELPSFSGFSKADLATFRMLLKRKYGTDAALRDAWGDPTVTLDTATMPSVKDICSSSAGALLDVRRDRRIGDWFEYRNASLGHAFITLCKTVKECSGNKLLAGGYYAYAIGCAASSTHAIHDVGHNAFIEAAASPYVDFCRAPAGYAMRRPGLSGKISVPWATLRMRGKVVFVECDLRTPLRHNRGSDDLYVCRSATIDASVDMMDRFFGKMAATGNSYYWYDITDGAFLNPALEAAMKKHLELYEALPPVQNLTPCEIAAVGDRDTIYHTKRNNSRDTLMEAAARCPLQTLPKIGAPFDICCTADLVTGKMPPAKFYVMYNSCMLSREYREALMRRFEAEKAHVLWLYCAGASYPDRGPAGEFCADFLGVKMRMDKTERRPKLRLSPEWGGLKWTSFMAGFPWFVPEAGFDEVIGRDENGDPALVSVKRGNSTHYLSTLPDLSTDIIRKLAEKAGVRFYTPDTVDPAWIGHDLVFLHCATSGAKKLTAPPGTVLKQVLGPEVKPILKSGETWSGEAGRTYGFQVVRE